MKIIKNRKKAFTLVEIILSLMILGIIVVIMMQILTPSVSVIETKAKLNAAKSLVTRAVIQYQAEHLCSGNLSICDAFSFENSDIERIYNEVFLNRFKLEKNCGILIGQGCFSHENYIYQDGQLFPNPDNDANAYKIRLQNSMAIAFSEPHPKCQDNVCLRIIIDTNGPLGPNIVNKDIFQGVITTTQVRFDSDE